MLGQQAHLAALAAAKLQAKMDAEQRRCAFREATAEQSEGIISLACVKDSPLGALTEFPLFTKLPVELHLKICKYLLDVPVPFVWMSNGHEKLTLTIFRPALSLY